MGHGIAQVAAQSGYRVMLIDTTPDLVQRGLDRVRENLDAGVARGKLTEEQRYHVLEQLSGGADLEHATSDADLIIEAVPERMELKVRVMHALEAHAPVDAILATNTSSLSVSDLQLQIARPERVVGLHFFNPVHIMKLVEVVRGRVTTNAVVDASVAFVRSIGKEPIVVMDSPGFASSRLGIALGLEAMRMLEQGVASAEDIDKAMELGYRHPMGPLKLTDVVGLDVRLDIATYLHDKLGSETFRPPEILRRKVAEGKLGKKSGEGFYTWSEET
jgi:3-hydroxybutyryl-CoA dehydrogenase